MATKHTPIPAGESRLFSVESFLQHNLNVPQFQRPFDWEDSHIQDFVDDLREAQSKKIPLFLGLVVLHPDGDSQGIIDGQQRLTTLMLAIAAVGGADKVLGDEDGLSTTWVRPRRLDVPFVKALVRKNPEPPKTLSQWRLSRAMAILRECSDIKLETLLNCELIVYVAPNLAGATRLFERINLRGKKVGEFDLVKNKLIEWAVLVDDHKARSSLEAFITERYDTLYVMLDPKADDDPYDSDKLLKCHWILFHDTQFKSGDRVLHKVDQWIKSETENGRKLAVVIEQYLNSLVDVTPTWAWVERPYVVSRADLGQKLHSAVLDFAKLGREGELQPLLVAAIQRFGKDAESIIRFCEINSFRAAMGKKNSNHGRSVKWRLARQLYNNSLVDGQESLIDSPKDVVHQLFWLNTPWWNREEAAILDEPMTAEEAVSEIFPSDALDNAKFYSQHRSLVHYFFWRYGKFLLASADWKNKVKVDIDPFQESVWFEKDGFPSWDIEHIYPQNPREIDGKAGRTLRAEMEHWLNHLGNLTVLPIRDNRGMQNAPFTEKLDWMLEQKKVPFNELLCDRSYTGNLMDRPHWGPNNCKRRITQLREFADSFWGTNAITALGVGRHDKRIRGFVSDDDDEDSAQ